MKISWKLFAVTSLVWRFWSFFIVLRQSENVSSTVFHESFPRFSFWCPDDVIRENTNRDYYCCMLHETLRNVKEHRHVSQVEKCFSCLAHENFYCFLLSLARSFRLKWKTFSWCQTATVFLLLLKFSHRFQKCLNIWSSQCAGVDTFTSCLRYRHN